MELLDNLLGLHTKGTIRVNHKAEELFSDTPVLAGLVTFTIHHSSQCTLGAFFNTRGDSGVADGDIDA